MARLLQRVLWRFEKAFGGTSYPNGHFYSPVVDVGEVRAREASLWPTAHEVIGIDFGTDYQLRVLRDWFPRFISDYDYPEHAPAGDADLDRFYTGNSQFSLLDARALFVLMRAWRPDRIIEVGSGYSSLLMADVNARFLEGSCEITCIEPYPRPFLRRGVPGLARLLEQRVQDVPLSTFSALQAGDVLFIDSSHVSKTGSDVNYLFFEVLPRLQAGVRIHIHDIFLPNEYPRSWVVDENRSWNEQYLVRALLMYSSGFVVRFGSSFAFTRYPDEVRKALALEPGAAFGGGSLWIERTG